LRPPVSLPPVVVVEPHDVVLADGELIRFVFAQGKNDGELALALRDILWAAA